MLAATIDERRQRIDEGDRLGPGLERIEGVRRRWRRNGLGGAQQVAPFGGFAHLAVARTARGGYSPRRQPGSVRLQEAQRGLRPRSKQRQVRPSRRPSRAPSPRAHRRFCPSAEAMTVSSGSLLPSATRSKKRSYTAVIEASTRSRVAASHGVSADMYAARLRLSGAADAGAMVSAWMPRSSSAAPMASLPPTTPIEPRILVGSATIFPQQTLGSTLRWRPFPPRTRPASCSRADA